LNSFLGILNVPNLCRRLVRFETSHGTSRQTRWPRCPFQHGGIVHEPCMARLAKPNSLASVCNMVFISYPARSARGRTRKAIGMSH
jgi:hypothetical protein